MPKIFDNIETNLTKGLKNTLKSSKRADFCVGYFNLRGWNELAEAVDELEGDMVPEKDGEEVHRVCRLLIGMQTTASEILRKNLVGDNSSGIDAAEASKIKKQMAEEFKAQLTFGTPTNADEETLRNLSRQMKEKKVVIKLHRNYPLHAKLYLCYLKDRQKMEAFLGSSNLTFAGLSKQGELNVDVEENDANLKLQKWFDDRWNDRWSYDITQELIEIIDNSWAAEQLMSPYYIYLKIAYHLSKDARAGMNEFRLPKIFEKQLLDFQEDAVLLAAHHLNKRNGVLIGDVVGLGKTITATALAKLFQEDFNRMTVIICPKNLVQMWEFYAEKYELNAKIVSLSKVQSELPKITRRYPLVIIDESHNLRNANGTRYQAIKKYLEDFDSKVVLLSATPYNKSLADISNQLRFFIPDDQDLGICPDRYIEFLGGQEKFNLKHPDTFNRSIKAFEKSDFSDDWRELMRLYLVRRTRSYIKEYRAKRDPDNGRKYLLFADGTKSYFPDRIPKKAEYHFDANDPKDQYAKFYSENVTDIINALELPRYGLKLFLSEKPTIKPTSEEVKILSNLSRAGKRLMGFCRTNLFKRLESSDYSFLLSLGRHALRNYVFIHALENNLPLPIGKSVSQNLDDFLEDDDTDSDETDGNALKLILKEETYLQKAKEVYQFYNEENNYKKFDWIRSEFFGEHCLTLENGGKKSKITVSLLKTLKNDCKQILSVLALGNDRNSENDRQLNALYDLIQHQHGKDKVLVFTQFADTARYLAEQLKNRGVCNLEAVTGADENPTFKAQRFSPKSNHVDILPENELRVLISTDVLSEGQNLQDAHIIVNFDLPWAIIRLIQRAGRVDRIGQKSEKILCYSFLPEDGIEKIINLRKRLAQRIEENAHVVGSDETFFDGDAVSLSNLYNEKSGILDEADDGEVDLASQAYQIWKTAIDLNPALERIIPDIPNVVYTAKKNEESPLKDGVIVYAQSSYDSDALVWLDKNGQIITHSHFAILNAARCAPTTEALPRLPEHHELVGEAVRLIKEDANNFTGTLGNTSGIRAKVYNRMKNYASTVFATEGLKKAIDDIFNYPLKTHAKNVLFGHVKTGISDKNLADLLITLREDSNLIVKPEKDNDHNQPQIICSLGIVSSPTP